MKQSLLWIVPLFLALLIGGAIWLRFGSCERWETAIGRPGFDDPVRTLAIFDHGEGPMLYAGGFFLEAGGQSAARLARWDGEQWSPLGAAINGPVRAMTVFDDGRGPALFVAGQFTSIRGLPVNHIVRFDGESWSVLAGGVNDWVTALTVFDDGDGPALYATGEFTEADGEPAMHIARWDGANWSALGEGIDHAGYALAVFDEGRSGGPALYVGGRFTYAGGEPALHIARWNGNDWSSLGEGTDRDIGALVAANRGNSPKLYVGGRFTSAGGAEAMHIAAWDGERWSAIGQGVDREVTALAVVNLDASGEAGHRLYAAGRFTTAGSVAANRIARWDGRQWSALGGGVNDWIAALLADVPGENITEGRMAYTVHAAGSFTRAGRRRSEGVAAWRVRE